ncbi:MAG: bifunctional 4-hydroxy-3-methylbut-2-enyl diphosphate reductase/30S ribosomal protein S1 [Clostridia bacterium]|nr:bifunctional 4-hydroxy-3-methylbut-2-enyl diphosphate reductase/30S ribosomal protein S1 [Clostridia bacterium]
MPVEVASHAGFCMGVSRAVEKAEAMARDRIPSCTLGELIHNPEVIRHLAERGLEPIHDPAEAAGRRVLIRSHGVSPQVLQDLEKAGDEILDLTCPFVDKLHRIVEEGSRDGTPVILVGERDHPEVRGTAGWAHGEVMIVAEPEEAEQLPAIPRAVAVCQTTFPHGRWEEILAVLKQKVAELDSRCTICNATEIRQKEARELAGRVDAMIVVGGRNSANTRKLYDICRSVCPRTILVESAAEIPPAFANKDSEKIGITAGASTPTDSLKEVVTRMSELENKDLNPTAEVETNNDFMAEVESTLVRIRPGQTLTGKVVQITEDEVCVSIGYKADGLIKRTDLVDQDVKLDDEIEVEVVKVNDGEGNVLLSQRNIVNRKAWDAMMEKYEAGEYVDAVGKEAVKGGLIADIAGVRAFVPASQLSQRYVEKIADFVGKDMKLKILEVDTQKKRVVASRKAVVAEEAAAKKKEAWERLEEGMVIHGIVRRLTDFGAFVDVGGVDGLIHITDLCWGRIKHPSEVVKPNQEVDVKILSLDPERERIQLGYKQLQPHPWDAAVEKFPVGEVVEGKVVRITDFGAFVELEPGLDGLVHISQCATTRVAKVEDAVKVGDVVNVKILGVDPEKKRISLSIRQAIEPEPVAEEAAETAAADVEYEVVATEDSVSEKFAEATEEVKEAAEDKAEEVKEAATEAVETVKEAVAGAVEAAQETVEKVKKTAKKKVEEAKETVEEKVEEAKEAVEETVEKAKKTVKKTKKAAEDAVEEVKEAVEEAKE